MYRDDIWRYILSGIESFNSDLILAGVFLQAIKAMSLLSDMLETFWYNFNMCTSYLLCSDSTDTYIAIIDKLEQVGDALLASIKLSIGLRILSHIRHWTETYPRGIQAGDLFQSFFGFAFVYLLHSYVQNKLVTGYLINSVLEGSMNLYPSLPPHGRISGC
jgi:hypothetical protein